MRSLLITTMRFRFLLSFLVAAPTIYGAPPVDFTRDIRPILSDHCYNCHGQDPASRKADLRLDIRDAALKGGESGEAAIVPGQPEKSALIARIMSHDRDEVMPPPKAKNPLKPEQIEKLRQWVASGAEYQGHWGFIAPTKVATAAEAGSAIDTFIRARLAKEGLAPAPEADKATLLRRLSLDLIGLPPSPAELDAFEKDAAPEAYTKQVERLLASPHFGEKWARWWMDAARYADSDGYEKDLPRQQWAWRDWVIAAFNADKPYDQFIIEQIAGDLLPPAKAGALATQAQRVATGFLRNGMVNEEGAIIAEQFRIEGVIDRIDAIGKSVLGLSLNCTQCHDHKFDPVTQREYFGIFAYLNNDYEAIQRVHSPAEEKEKTRILAETEKKMQVQRNTSPGWEEWLATWEKGLAEKRGTSAWITLKPDSAEAIGGLAHPNISPDGSVLSLGHKINDGVVVTIADTRAAALTGLRLDALTHGDLPFEGPGRGPRGQFAISELVVEVASLAKPDEYKPVALKNATADVAQREGLLAAPFRKGDDDRRLVGGANFLIDGREDTAWGTDRDARWRNQPSHAVVQFVEPLGFAEGTRFKVSFKFRHGGKSPYGDQAPFLGRWKLSVTGDAAPRAETVPPEVLSALQKPAAERSQTDSTTVFDFWRFTLGGWKKQNEEIDKLWASWPEGTSVLNVADRAPEYRRETHLLLRGDWQSPGPKVEPIVPAALHSLPADAPPNRLTFARWLVDKRSPTTARVLANRTWQALFGAGFIESPEDFGTRAAPPTHPELLDWLACELMEPSAGAVAGVADPGDNQLWSFKHLLRTIVASATYRQSSKLTPELAQRDPQNKLLARGARFRVEAEQIRDLALAASGLLDTKKIGGPSIFPPVPEGIFALSYADVNFWDTATGPERYCRSLYVFRRRSLPEPSLSNFDAPNADASCSRRMRSNTPLAALASLNETVFTEAAQALARRVLREGGATDAERVRYAFRLCASRAPRPAEEKELLDFLATRRARLAKGELKASDIAFADLTKPADLPADATPNDAAAWTILARVLLNLDATLNKG